MFFWNLLTTSGENPVVKQTFWDKWGTMIILGGIAVLFILGMWWSSRKRKKQQEEATEKLNSLKPGTKIETIGGVFGTIVEMNAADGTFVLETGSEAYGKTYIRFDRNAIARIEPEAVPAVEAAPAAPVEETPAVDEAPEFEPIANKEEVAEEKAPEAEENKD